MIVSVLVIWQFLLLTVLSIAGLQDRIARAMAGMAWGLSILWIGGFGLLSIFGRDMVCGFIHRIPLPSGVKFFGLATILALVEEAIATLMTNCAPLFGVEIGEAYITASANYLDVIIFHSVVVFLAQFATWAWLLSRYEFRPFTVFWLFGITGFLNETLFAGPQPLALAQWILIYGLMVYLPASCYPNKAGRRRVRWWHYPVAVILPILASLPVVALLLGVIAPDHPSVHFPPMQTK
ncbi:MAG: hypothetical protein N2039_01955 [Gemmataceae bacterium]|nr:hypothetical protein [Gemmataceae bacterium]